MDAGVRDLTYMETKMFSRNHPPETAAKGWQPWGALVPFLGIFFVAATVLALTAVLQNAGLIDAEENPVGLPGFVAFLLLPFSALAVVVLAWVRFVERRPLATIGLGGSRRAQKFLYGLLAGAGMVTAIVAGSWIAGGYHAADSWHPVQSAASLASIATLLVCFSVQSSVEELVFRGWMPSAIAAKFHLTVAILLSSLVFVCLHFDPRANWIFVLNVFLFAVFACYWVVRTNNIWGVMGWHAGWNWLLAVGFGLRVTSLDARVPALLLQLTPDGPDYLTGGIEGPEGSIVCTLALTCGITYQLLRARRSAPSPASHGTPLP
jgi:membrane protease YdiL (CAAX protease family)